MKSSQRIYGLDILRALAIFFVVQQHGLDLLSPHMIALLTPFTIDGVTIFFVLSGFLIGNILIHTLTEKKASLTVLYEFWKKRWFRTLPNYWLVLTLLCILSFLMDPQFVIGRQWKYFIFLQNFNSPQPPFFAESWSLSVEEWFYLLIPVLLFGIKRITRWPVKRVFQMVVIFVMIGVSGLRIYKYLYFHIESVSEWDAHIGKQVFTRLDGIMFGVLGAYLSAYHSRFWEKYKNICFLTGLLLMCIRISAMNIPMHNLKIYMCIFHFPLYQVASMLMLPLFSQIKTGKGIMFRLITLLSTISYSVYLLHFSLVKRWLITRYDWFGFKGLPFVITRYVFYWWITIILSILLYRYFEKPFMDFRKKGGVKNR